MRVRTVQLPRQDLAAGRFLLLIDRTGSETPDAAGIEQIRTQCGASVVLVSSDDIEFEDIDLTGQFGLADIFASAADDLGDNPTRTEHL